MDQHWLTIVIVVILIVGIIFDGVRRMRKARYDSLQMKLKPTKKKNMETDESKHKSEKGYGSEFPNGGARISSRIIDPDRIKQVRNKYNFGSDMSAWRERVVEKIAEHRGKLQPHDDDNKPEERIEPSVDADPLMDDSRSRNDQSVDSSKVYSKNVSSDDYDKYDDSEEISGRYLDSDEDSDIANDINSDSNLDNSHDESFDYDLYDKADAELDNTENSLKDSKSVKYKTADKKMSHAVDTNKQDPDMLEGKAVSSEVPVQVSLNLDDSVPMLMDTFDEKSVDKKLAKAEPVKKNAVKASLNPFNKQSATKNANTNNTSSTEDRKNASTSVATSQASAETKIASPSPSIPEEVLVIHVRASQDNVFYGDELLELILEHGLRFGAMDIFHRHAGEDGEGPILFSLSNMVKPGIFDLHTFDEFSTVGVSLFLALPVETGSYMEAFDTMLTTAKAIAKQLQGELKDENRSVLTGQTIEHYRERIRDFSRRQRLEMRKL